MKTAAKFISIIFLSVFIFHTSASCTSLGQKKKDSGVPLSREFSENGLISSSTYQVVISIEAKNEDEAKLHGREIAVDKTLTLLFQEVFIYRNLSLNGRKTIQNFVEEKGKIVKIQKTSEKAYSIVFQVSQKGLKQYLEKIR